MYITDVDPNIQFSQDTTSSKIANNPARYPARGIYPGTTLAVPGIAIGLSIRNGFHDLILPNSAK